MTEQELQAIEALAAAATPGPWEAGNDIGEGEVYGVDGYAVVGAAAQAWTRREVDANTRFIAAARTAVPALVAEVRRLRRVEDAAKALSAAQRSGDLHQSQRALLSFRHALGEP
jgi:hypothetical protein